MAYRKSLEFVVEALGVLGALINAEFFMGAMESKTTDMGGRDSGNVYIMSNQAKGVGFHWIAERGPASDRLWSHASAGNSFESTIQAMQGLGNGYYVQIVAKPAGLTKGTVKCEMGRALPCCGIKYDIYASVGTSKSGLWSASELLKGADKFGQDCNCKTMCL